jgi:signal transduction histidine kinase
MSLGEGEMGGRGGAARSRRFVVAASVVVGLFAIAATLFAVAETRRLESNVREAVGDMMTSIRLVAELETEVEKRRALVGYHIAADTPREMEPIDGELADASARIKARIHGYGPWIDVPGEQGSWERARRALESLDEVLERAVAFSRQNRDDDARQVMDRSKVQFASAKADLDDVIALNDRGAAEGLLTFTTIRRRLVAALVGIGLLAVMGIFLLARWSMRQIALREQEMTLNARRLEARNRELDAFAGRVAHDIRGDLAAIVLAMASLADRVPKEDRGMQVLRRGTRKMEALVDDLLTLARVEAMVPGRCDPAAVVAQVAEDLGPRIAADTGQLRVSVAPAVVACSEGLLRQVVTNLVDNAVKYRRADVAPEVEISGAPAAGGYDLRVTDNGVGISPDDSGRVFEPLYRSARTSDLPGTGLGLSIVKRVADASRGTLSLVSRLGQGSTFVLRLPLADGRDRGA